MGSGKVKSKVWGLDLQVIHYINWRLYPNGSICDIEMTLKWREMTDWIVNRAKIEHLLLLWLSFLERARIIAARWLSAPAMAATVVAAEGLPAPPCITAIFGPVAVPDKLARELPPPHVPVTLLAALPPEAFPPPPPPPPAFAGLGMLSAPVGLSKGPRLPPDEVVR